MLKVYMPSELILFILKVANIRCFILIAVAVFHNIIRKQGRIQGGAPTRAPPKIGKQYDFFGVKS
jgi:hypothetical protein